ncbi:MAG: GH36-type glycosyl hydrolase domain-containing protein, partial [Vicinamibacterales bacterium]
MRPQVPFEPLPAVTPKLAASVLPSAPVAPPPGTDLESFNGLGGFGAGGREYVIHVNQDAIPPAPWCNVVAHPRFGFAATELGPGVTWSENSHDNRLTPWRNDPVEDPQGEALFLRDDETGLVWSATPLPAGDGLAYTVRHGQGYTAYEHSRDGIDSRLLLFVPPDETVKIFRVALRNESSRRRRVSVTLYVDWVLGEHRARTRLHVVTSREPATGALIACNAFREPFGHRLAFLDLCDSRRAPSVRTLTGDRTEFVGRNGSLRSPAALARDTLSGRTGAALDPCGAVQVRITLEPGEEHVLIGQLGEASDVAGVRAITERYREAGAADAAFDKVSAFWDELLGTIQVRTPEPSMDVMLNRWLLYQALSCRIWGRSAFYQSSGAFGFRDQLQDVLALLYSRPQMVREQLLRAASRQFLEGDVQHWWHEPGGQGVRTKFSDDRLWLVYV